MKTPIFTDDPFIQDPEAFPESRVVNAEEWSQSRARRMETDPDEANKHRSRRAFLEYMEANATQEIELGRWLNDYLERIGVRRLLGLGSGDCCVEYLLKTLGKSRYVMATDFDPGVIGLTSPLLTEIDDFDVFDIKKDDFARFRGRFDAALMIDVFYAFSDEEGRRFFRQARESEFNRLIITSSAFFPWRRVLRYNTVDAIIRGLKRMKLYQPARKRFHGWGRTVSEIVGLSRGDFEVTDVVDLKAGTGQVVVGLKAMPG